MREHENPLFRGHSVALTVTLVHKLSADRFEDGLEHRSAEDEGGVVVRQRVAESRHVAEHQPASVVYLVSGRLVGVDRRATSARCLEVPVVQAVEKHLGEIVHRLPFPLRQVTELVENEVRDCLGNARTLEWRLTERTLDRRFRHR